MVYWSAWAATEEHHRLEGQNNRTLFLTVPEAGSPKQGVGGFGFSWRLSLWLAVGHLLAVSSFDLFFVH